MFWSRKPKLHITLEHVGVSPNGYPLTHVFLGGKPLTANTYHKEWWPHQVSQYLTALKKDYKLVITRI